MLEEAFGARAFGEFSVATPVNTSWVYDTSLAASTWSTDGASTDIWLYDLEQTSTWSQDTEL